MTRKFSLFAASLIFATGLFGAWMVTSSTVSEAAMKPGIDVSQIELNAPRSPFDPNYERNMGVLDTFAGSFL
jgi:hypothetical protein